MTNEQIELLNRSEITDLMNRAHHPVSDTASIGELQLQLVRLQRTRTLAFWHDHSTILQQGYILFAVTVVRSSSFFHRGGVKGISGSEESARRNRATQYPHDSSMYISCFVPISTDTRQN